MARLGKVSSEDEETIKNVGAVAFEGKILHPRKAQRLILALSSCIAGTDTVCTDGEHSI